MVYNSRNITNRIKYVAKSKGISIKFESCHSSSTIIKGLMVV